MPKNTAQVFPGPPTADPLPTPPPTGTPGDEPSPTGTPQGDAPPQDPAVDLASMGPITQGAPAPTLKTSDASFAGQMKTQGPRYFVALKQGTPNGNGSAFYKDADGVTHEVAFVDNLAEVQEHELEYFADESRFVIATHQ